MMERNKLLSKHNIKIVPTRDDMSHIFDLNNALSEGNIVTMPADRIVGSQKSVEVTLLGGKAQLPMGPFLIPTMRDLDVISVNVMKTSPKGYTIYITPLPYDKAAPRQKKINQLADSYTEQIDKMLKRYPTQWYNFFDFWKDENKDA